MRIAIRRFSPGWLLLFSLTPARGRMDQGRPSNRTDGIRRRLDGTGRPRQRNCRTCCADDCPHFFKTRRIPGVLLFCTCSEAGPSSASIAKERARCRWPRPASHRKKERGPAVKLTVIARYDFPTNDMLIARRTLPSPATASPASFAKGGGDSRRKKREKIATASDPNQIRRTARCCAAPGSAPT